MATLDEVKALVEPGDALRYHAELRRGGLVGITDERVIVIGDDQPVRIHLDTIAEVTIQSFDWFLGLLSAALVGIGLLSLDRSVIGSLFFIAFGLASLGWTYRKRGQVQIHLHNRRKAVTFSLEATEEFREALGAALTPYQDQPTAGLE